MVYSSMYYLTRAVQQQFLESPFTSNGAEINFHDVRTAADFWFVSFNPIL